MTNDEMRVVLAKWAGKCTHGPDLWEREGTEGDMELVCTVCKSALYKVRAPDYLNDLDAVAALEARLTDKEYANYLACLHCIVHDLQDKWYDTVRGSVLNFEQIRPLHSATAEQRCRALVAALKLTL